MILRRPILSNQNGQTTLEYLLLLAMVFITIYLFVSGPFADFTSGFITSISASLRNLVRTGEIVPGEIEPGNPKHPSNPDRLRGVHL